MEGPGGGRIFPTTYMTTPPASNRQLSLILDGLPSRMYKYSLRKEKRKPPELSPKPSQGYLYITFTSNKTFWASQHPRFGNDCFQIIFYFFDKNILTWENFLLYISIQTVYESYLNQWYIFPLQIFAQKLSVT